MWGGSWKSGGGGGGGSPDEVWRVGRAAARAAAISTVIESCLWVRIVVGVVTTVERLLLWGAGVAAIRTVRLFALFICSWLAFILGRLRI